jgi:tRNA threonylcarbamoyladenosine biosynthesis protein TsaB
MKILLIDTCGTSGSIALADASLADPDLAAIVATEELPGRSASEKLLPALRALALRSGIALQALDTIVVVHGPGSFTGVRVGVSAAKGLCDALGVSLVAVSRLAVLAQLAAPGAGRVIALLDAARSEFYFGDYADVLCHREALLTRDEVLAVAGRGAQVVMCEPGPAEAISGLRPQLVAEPRAADALPLALRRIRSRAFDDVAALDANYLRRTDAEIFASSAAGTRRVGHE